MEHIVKILSVKQITHNVKSFDIEKPVGYQFVPGQATDVSIHTEKWKDELRPFTFTALNEWPNLQFTIKIYNDHEGVTHELGRLKTGDELIIRDVWGAIAYKGEGYFIAGGAGITPFIAILRQLHKNDQIGNNELFFSNKTPADIILHSELDAMLGPQAHYLISGSDEEGYEKGHINKDFLASRIKDFSRPFYLCGPDKMITDISTALTELGASPDAVIFEK